VAAILKPSSDIGGSLMTGSATSYDLVLRGYSYTADSLENSFVVSSSVAKSTAEQFLAENKRFFVGANKQNLTGTVLNQSDVRVESFRSYLSALTEEDQKSHARDFKVFGQDYALEESNLLIKNSTSAELPKYATNYLHWSFNTITGSNAAGSFDVYDMSSKRSGYGSFNNILSNEYPAVGHGFPVNSSKAVSVFQKPTSYQNLPEEVDSYDLVKLGVDEEGHEIFEKSSRPVTRFFSFEKSMYRSISREMLNFVGSVSAFNNLIGDPINKYRKDYKDLSKLRQFFFSFVSNEPSLEKYLTYYRWLDTSISKMIDQLKPATVEFSEDIRNMIESHVFERNKYQHRFPTAEMEPPPLEAPALGINWRER
jgi:hypothetical protein